MISLVSVLAFIIASFGILSGPQRLLVFSCFMALFIVLPILFLYFDPHLFFPGYFLYSLIYCFGLFLVVFVSLSSFEEVFQVFCYMSFAFSGFVIISPFSSIVSYSCVLPLVILLVIF